MKELTEIAKSAVNNLHQSYVFEVISEFQKKDANEIRDELRIDISSKAKIKPFNLLESAKRHILTRALRDDDEVKFLMSVPVWAGFKPNTDYLETEEQAILAGKRSALAMLWIMMLPAICARPTVLASEIENQGLETLVENLLMSEESRAVLNRVMSLELINRGFVEEYFEISGLDSGYVLDDSMRKSRIQAMIGLMVMKASNCPFNLDKVFNLPEHRLIEETTLYIITMQTRASLAYQISGGGSSSPFDWPLVGTARVFGRLISTLDVLRRAASRMTTCSLFISTIQGKEQAWAEREFTSFLVREIADYYSGLLRMSSGGGKNKALEAFIDILAGENIEIAARVMESEDRPLQLYEELSDCKRRAGFGEKARISPERRFRVVFSNLKRRLEETQSNLLAPHDLEEEIVNSFDAIMELIEKHTDSLGTQVDKFTEQLCFETSFHILQILNLGTALGDLPWVSRYFAEEAARISISRGDLGSLDEKHRMKRIVSAFTGGVVYLVLQAQK